jgi:hypothetical protein
MARHYLMDAATLNAIFFPMFNLLTCLAHTDYCPFWDEILNQDLNRAIFPSKS